MANRRDFFGEGFRGLTNDSPTIYTVNMETAQKTQGVIYSTDSGKLEFLILHRSPEEGGYWQPLTGTVEKNETELDCLKRELREEVGIDEHDAKISDVIHSFEWSHDGATYSEFVRGVELPRQAKIILSDEHDEYKWCGLEEALSLLKHESNKEGFRRVYHANQ